MKQLRLVTRPRTAFHASFLASLLSGSPASAALLEVPAQYATIQAAVDAAASGDEIRIAPGVYTGQAFIQQKQLKLVIQNRLLAAPAWRLRGHSTATAVTAAASSSGGSNSPCV